MKGKSLFFTEVLSFSFCRQILRMQKMKMFGMIVRWLKCTMKWSVEHMLVLNFVLFLKLRSTHALDSFQIVMCSSWNSVRACSILIETPTCICVEHSFTVKVFSYMQYVLITLHSRSSWNLKSCYHIEVLFRRTFGIISESYYLPELPNSKEANFRILLVHSALWQRKRRKNFAKLLK